jgi:hypothetical protein
VYQERLKDWYETHQRAFGLKESCIGKLDRCNDRKICEMLSENETVETRVTPTFLSVDCHELENSLYVEQAIAYRISCDI